MQNSTLLNAANAVIANPAATYFRLKFVFTNASTGSEFLFSPFKVTSLVINQDFVTNCYDDIRVTMTVCPKDYALFQDQGQNLECLLTLIWVDRNGQPVLSATPVQKKYMVMITDPRDVRKAIPDVHLYTTPSHSITFRLMESAVYDTRHRKINYGIQAATISDMIHSMLYGYNIKTIDLVAPDNTHTYDHIFIPSYMGFETGFSYLQSHYGVYAKGMCYYLTDGCAHIYPPYEVNPSTSQSLTFFQARTGYLGGSDFVHQKVGNDYRIVIDSQPHSYDLSVAGSENHGTGFTFNRASKITDGYTQLTPNTGADYTSDSSLMIKMDSTRTMGVGTSNLHHILATDNPFPHMSELAMHQASLMQVHWPGADPFSLIPGEQVTYCYDRNGTMIKKTGIVERGYFDIKAIKRDSDAQLFTCTGTLVLRLNPNESMILGTAPTAT